MQTEISSTNPNNDADKLVDIGEACKFWGGNRPLNPATIYRQVAEGHHPKPIKVGSLSRWSFNELLAERQRRMDAR